MTTPTPSPVVDTPPSPQQETQRARTRRHTLGIVRPVPPEGTPDPDGQWALALSGGGIRSATFNLGVLQGLAHTPDPGVTSATSNTPSRWPLLAQFDYLSTVSGGGYIGGFFSSLFVTGRLSGDRTDAPLQTTQRAYQSLQEEPPGRIHRDTNYEGMKPGKAALAWLRDNGRYMAPSGAGDMLYAVGIALRNWFATQYVVATLIIFCLAGLQAGRWALASHWPAYRLWEGELLHAGKLSDSLIWWSPSWVLTGLVAALSTVPLGIAYWFSHPAHPRQRGQAWINALNRVRPPPKATGSSRDDGYRDHLAATPVYWSLASVLGLLVGLILLALGWWVLGPLQRLPVGGALLGAGACTVLAAGWFMSSTTVARASGQGSITLQRVLLTRWLADSLKWLMVLGLLAAVETLGQTAWLWLSLQHGAVASGVLALLVWLIKSGAANLSDKPGQGWLSKLPMGLLAGVLGASLWLVVAAGLEIVLLQVAWPKGWANEAVLRDEGQSTVALYYALGALGLCAILAGVVRCFPGFLNLSTLQSLYSARIIRAYLGATNHARFTPQASGQARDVAEPIAGDSLSMGDIYRNPLAPLHFINVCVNQSVSPGEQLIQRDRKGKPLVVAPGGVYFDQQAYGLHASGGRSELSFPLSFGEWLGVSGAAFSTGLGRGTGLGMSLAMGFANVRLGRWWEGLPQRPDTHTPWLARWLPTQAYLLDELSGRFYGDHRPYQYLSDGGHFENTAVYELLRTDRPRQVRVIMVCDCGCDPDYTFDDLANLTRLVRIDHGLEITLHATAHEDTILKSVFTRPQDMARLADGSLPAPSGRCAVMLDVRGTERSRSAGVAPGELFARLILIKPVLLSDASVDIAQYRALHGAFPQETTMDQFFDEAQWESYRQLGLRISQRVCQGDGSARYRDHLWQTVTSGFTPATTHRP